MRSEIEILQDKAINEALSGNWRGAIKLNEKILTLKKNDLGAELRLGFGYLQMGQIAKSKKAYLRGLKLQPSNPIAVSNLEKLRILEKKGKGSKLKVVHGVVSDPNLFLNIIGKTKVISLINIGQAAILAKLKIGQKVFPKIKKRRVEMRDDNNDYIGALPDDISKRLILFLDAGSKYSVYIKEAAKNSVDIFIIEEKKGKKVAQYTSFPKNIQDDLKIISGEEEPGGEDEEKETDEETEAEVEAPVDLERLAEEINEDSYAQETAEAAEDEEE